MNRLHRLICYRWPELVGLGFVGLALNVWARDGTTASLFLLLAAAGCVLVLGSVGWLTGTQVVKHSRREQQQIEAGNHPMREITK